MAAAAATLNSCTLNADNSTCIYLSCRCVIDTVYIAGDYGNDYDSFTGVCVRMSLLTCQLRLIVLWDDISEMAELSVQCAHWKFYVLFENVEHYW